MSTATFPGGVSAAPPVVGSNGTVVPAPISFDPNFILPCPDTRPRPSPDSKPYNCEFLNGQWVVKPMSSESRGVASNIHGEFAIYLKQHRIGRAILEGLFPVPRRGDKTRNRQPGVAFVSAQRWAVGKRLPNTDPWPVIPDLAIEVLSPSNDAEDMQQKFAEYFAAGVRQVWLVSPLVRRIEVHSSPTEIRVFTGSDTLDAEPVLPGFRLALDDVFGPPTAE